MEAATGWQRHTIRGYIAGTLRKQMAPWSRNRLHPGKRCANAVCYQDEGCGSMSELEPCPLCRRPPSSKFTDIKAAIWCEPCGLHMEYSTAMVSLRIAEEHQRSIITKRWNTRPAPAATDTGLVTEGCLYLDGKNGNTAQPRLR
ncbi:DUF3489 domain-containing protein [Ochrobactrum tritici]|uniref:DUF3489 domain-containing protein n=1 Tax=Brucella tritici TaxID=94626 RepID=A0A7X6FPE4_9HYPH|nr:DUF3489 domain-containing protein [Brucella tritici]